ncbi:carboxylesterase/lipase family protein [Nocardia sp. NPDC058176]|uniref:carboxylesterase/lipase family protein n=1 Tax=Nocardia sp. NPDC058176 TaxID=3346368 RepID=UPI0036DB74D1
MRSGPEVRTAAGVVRGRWEKGIAVFRGIPYARPPVGVRRFRAPVATSAWAGVRNAYEFGPAVPQAGHTGSVMTSVTGTVDDGSDDCLSLSVWTPDPGDARLPVMVWIHGGAYLEGDSANPHCDGAILAAGGVVVVSVNYRTGFDGFAHLAGEPDNRGLLDQAAALRWVQENIGGFGGDAGTVTVFGQSAGAGCVAALASMPLAAGLFRRAIVQSIPCTFFTPQLASAISTRITAEVGVRATVADLTDIPAQALVDATETVIAKLPRFADDWGPMTSTPTPFSPVIDGDRLPRSPWRALADGAARDIDLLVGHTRDEYRLFAGHLAEHVTDDDVSETVARLAPAIDAGRYRAAYPEATPVQLCEIVHADWLFRMPSVHLADAHHAGGSSTWMYELCWAFDREQDASHSLDVLLVFSTLAPDEIRSRVTAYPNAADEVIDVARHMRADWVNFATTGTPGWTAYDSHTRPTRVYTAEPTTLSYPEERSRRLWEAVEFDSLDLVR